MPTVETWQVDKATQNASDNVAKCHKQLLSVMLDFKPCKRCNGWRKLLIDQGDLVVVRVVFLIAVHKIEHSSFDILRIIINSILPYNFPRKSCALCNWLVSHTPPPWRKHAPNFQNHWITSCSTYTRKNFQLCEITWDSLNYRSGFKSLHIWVKCYIGINI